MLLDLSVIPDFRNNTRYIIDLDQTSLGLPDRTYLMRGLNDTAVEAYLRLMVEAAHLLGVPDKEAARTDLMDALQFGITLANYSTPREERRNIRKLYNKMPQSELKKLAAKIEWDRYFNSLLTDKVASDEPVNVVVPEFVQRFGHLLETTNEMIRGNRFRRNNFLFYGEADNMPSVTYAKSEKLITAFCRDHLKITVGYKDLERAHRLGLHSQARYRPMIVQFRS
ncbi:hypothetical protein HPB48_018866 [Haemaphysalis longicornis]|uniref:Peptidase M13 N-terminal domain-containing protein n=1 Tax=Haemaphysalis longicornis TaxID=44386 RepID=A0A9J6GT03_HAELO|nr:hypothetical protein HPB48_018866 [Haemaphysalis longicornis]